MRIFYLLSAYISHRQAGGEYIDCLKKLGHEVSCNYPDSMLRGEAAAQTSLKMRSLAFCDDPSLMRAAQAADLVILHEDPAHYSALYGCLPFLRAKRVVAYLPWENEQLPEEFIAPLSLVSGIWTCSAFSRAAFKTRFEEVEVLPHVVRRPQPGKADLAWANELLAAHGAQGACIFFSIMDGLNPRKNLPALLAAFGAARREAGADMRLVLKQYRVAMPIEQPGVINVTEALPEGQMAALHAVSHAYVSAHHAEGWGLGLSTAMSFGKIAIATGYSGNLEFMNRGNSILLPYTMAPVAAEMAEKIPLFTTAMRWADVDVSAMKEAMRKVAGGRVEPALGREAALITRRFGPDAVRAILAKLL